MSQSSQRTTLGLFTITANSEDTQMITRHIVKPTATAHLLRVKTFPALDCGGCIAELHKGTPLAAGETILDVHLLPKRSTLDSFDVEHQKLLVDELSPRNVKSWKWALVVSAILSSLFLFALDNTIVADIQPAIVETIGDVGKLSWLGVAFVLGAASTNLVSTFL